MNKTIFAIIILLLVVNFNGLSQQHTLLPNPNICGTTDYSDARKIDLNSLKKTNTNTTYHIPVVFHVFHSSNPQQFTESKARAIISMLNKDFNAENSNLSSVQSAFKNIIGDIEFEFHLAQIDKNGNATNGITFTTEYIPGDNPGSNNTLKVRKNWNTGDNWSGQQKYLQIWVTTNVNGDSNGSGWSYLPDSDGGGKMAGIVYNLKYLGSGSDYMHHVLTHEVGHYFGLSHTFGPSYDACGDDGIDDTPITKCYVHECRTGDLCGDGLVNVENFMDYTTCACMFTNGQKDLMYYWIEHRYRNTLWSEENLKATGVWTEITTNEVVIPENDDLSIFPNPTKGIITIYGLKSYEKKEAKIYTTNGRLLKTTLFSNNQINISDLNNGIYIIEIIQKKRALYRKKIKLLK